jgi:hypothetical protein
MMNDPTGDLHIKEVQSKGLVYQYSYCSPLLLRFASLKSWVFAREFSDRTVQELLFLSMYLSENSNYRWNSVTAPHPYPSPLGRGESPSDKKTCQTG